MKPVNLSALITAACLATAPFTVSAQFQEDAAPFTLAGPAMDKAAAGKIGHQLMNLYVDHVNQGRDKGSKDARVQSAVATPGISPAPVPTQNGLVTIDAIAQGDARALLADLKALGLRNGSTWGRVVSGQMPVGRLAALNGLSTLVSAAPALNSRNAGLTTSQGDAAQASDIARSLYGLDGSGVTVGSLSDSYDCTSPGAAAVDQANDDLPANVQVLLDISSGCIDEGRAMMQLIHDVAPGTDQAFHTAFTGIAGFANGIVALQQEAGADIIVDDIIYFAEPMFQDGPIAQAATFVADNGSAYFSSAGNGSFNSWETFDGFVANDAGLTDPFGSVLHDFDPGPGVDVFQEFVLLPGRTPISFQWDQPYASAGSATGSASDLDIWVAINGTFLFGAFSDNIGGDPVEILGINNPGGPVVIQIAISQFTGPAPTVMKYVTFGSDSRFGGGPAEYATNSPTSYGHSNAANMAGVGAAAYFNTFAFNDFCDPACVNSFSALGGVPILFDADDNPVTIVRERPNFVGPDGGNTTFFGSDVDGDGFPNFFGTSASAPHAAAAAALIKQTNPSLTPAEIYALLEDTATDMDVLQSSTGPVNVGSGPGFDFRTGYGFINVDAAVDAAATDPRNPKKRLVCQRTSSGAELTLSVSVNAVPAFIRNGDKFGPCE